VTDDKKRVPLFNRLMLECRDVSKFITHSMDEPLTIRQRLRVRWHLFICPYCRRFQKQVFWLHSVLRQKSETLIENETKDVCLSNDAKERIKKVLEKK
jgi:hypothetical protein